MIIDGEGLPGVDVSLVGGPSDESFTTMTDVDGMYRFEDLRPGDYTVSIINPDTRDYEFAATSQDVSVDLDETGTVSFTGVLLRTSGISGRVSVEGMGLDGITVTLSGAADATRTTDAGGQYSFSGLAAGDYTVTIAVDDPAYVFDSMSQDRTVGDDDSQIVNFEGQHARTASVSGMAFIDELNKNKMMDAGEHPLAQAGIPVALVGPGVNDQRLSATGADGSFSFPGLRAGSYQLVVPIDATVAAALKANDVAYGGPGTGYEITLGVGEAASQAIPFDITHTMVNFTVSLKSGDEMGDPLPGASVSLYGANSAMVGSGMTGDDGNVSIKVARAMTSGNMVNAGVSAEGYDVADGMTAVSWDPQKFETSGANSNDIVNLNVDVNISGATVMTEYGGGEPLGDWAISVMMGDAAVEGAPTMLGDDGSAAFKTTVASVPASFTISVADDQDDDLDGGEMYESSDGAYTHTGLKVAGAMDADPIVVTYTTQTLKVFVHHELDQIRGYTGNVGHRDVRMSGLLDLEIRHASGNDGRFTSPISNDDWDASANTSDKDGVYTFSHLPADMDIVVRADVAMDGYKLLDLERLDTYRNMDENGVTGGAFGAMGGWGHTVALCPLEEIEPTGQDFGDCASFGVVSLHNVSGLVWKRSVATSGTGFKVTDPKFESGVEVSLDPVDGKNLAGVGGDFTTASKNDPTTAFDDTHRFAFDAMAAGSYDLKVSDGWRVMLGDKGSEDPLGAALDPLGADVALDITPMTTSLYGFVRDHAGFGLKGVPVEVNGQTVATDDLGRYVASGVAAAAGKKINVSIARAGYPTTKKDTAFAANMPTQLDITLSGANNTVAITGTVTESGTGAGIKGVEIKVNGKAPLNASGGKLETGDDGTYTAHVAIQPNNDPLVMVSPKKAGYHFIPESRQASAIAGGSQSIDFTGYKATEIVGRVTAPGGGMPQSAATVTAYSDADMTSAIPGAKVTTTETGTFSVKVPTLSGTVYLGANPQKFGNGDHDYGPTNANFGSLQNAERYDWYNPPATRPGGAIAVIPGQTLQFGTFTGNSVRPRITKIERVKVKDPVENTTAGSPGVSAVVPDAATRGFSLVQGEPTDTIRVTWKYETRTATGQYSAAGDAAVTLETATGRTFASVVAGVTALATTNVDDIADLAADFRPASADGTTMTHERVTTYVLDVADSVDYGAIRARVSNTVIDSTSAAGATAALATSDPVSLAAVGEAVSGLRVTRSATDPDQITATWFGPASPRLNQRIALHVNVNATTNQWEWVVFPAAGATVNYHDVNDSPPTVSTPALTEPGETRRTTLPGHSGPNWGRWSWTFDLSDPVNNNSANVVYRDGIWPDDDNDNNGGSSSNHNVTAKALVEANMLRVDTRIGGAKWTMTHSAAAIPGS